MKVEFHPPARIFESTPLEITLEGVTMPKDARLLIPNLGEVPLRCKGDRCLGQFTVPKKGSYHITLIRTPQVWSTDIAVEETERISLKEELGIFLPTLFIILTGTILWTIRARRKNCKVT